MLKFDLNRRDFVKIAAGTGAALAMPNLGHGAVSAKMIGIQVNPERNVGRCRDSSSRQSPGADSQIEYGVQSIADHVSPRGGPSLSAYERYHCRHHDQQVRPPHPADGGEIHLLGRFRRCGSLTYGGSMKDRCRFSLGCMATAISIFFKSIHISRYSSKTWLVNRKER